MTITFEPITTAIAANLGSADNCHITVTAAQYWKAQVIYLEWSGAPTVGNRLPKITFADASANTVCEVVTTLNLVNTITGIYNFAAGAPTTGSFLQITTPLVYTVYGLPALTLAPGWTITASDTALLDGAEAVYMALSYIRVSPTLI